MKPPSFTVSVFLAGTTEYHQLGGLLTAETYFSQFWSLGSPRSRHWEIWYLARTTTSCFIDDSLTPAGEEIRGFPRVSFICCRCGPKKERTNKQKIKFIFKKRSWKAGCMDQHTVAHGPNLVLRFFDKVLWTQPCPFVSVLSVADFTP